MNINVLSLTEGEVEFFGFQRLNKADCISVRVLNDKLVINAGDICTASGKILIKISGKRTKDPNLYSLAKRYCKSKNTAFVNSPKNQEEYVQCSNISIPDDFSQNHPLDPATST